MASTSLAQTPDPGSLVAAADAIEAGELTPSELVDRLLHRVEEVDETVQGFLHLDKDAIRQAAGEADARRAKGAPLSRWDGLPIAIKDNISVAGQPCGCASKILERFTSPYDATVIARLKAHGLIPFGRTNMDEFAMGSSTEHSAFQQTRNPAHTDCVPGGSSGGSAAVVAAGEALAALGSDTGGSIRQPAGFCGCVGFKPTYGLVSRFGLVAFASSLDQIGPLTHTVRDAALLLDLIGGHDENDSTALPEPCGGFADALDKASVEDLRVGMPTEFFEVEGLSDEVRAGIETTRDRYAAAGAEIVDISLPHTQHAVATYYVIATAEASSNLARFDGIRYGRRAADCDDLLETYLESREQGFGDEVKRRILLGTYVLSSGYYDAYYLRAQKVRTLIRQDFEAAFERCDVILSPVAPTPAFRLGEVSDPLQMYLADIYTIPVNLAGNCGISLPIGTSEDGRPIGAQLIGPAMGEAAILNAAHWLQHDLQGS